MALATSPEVFYYLLPKAFDRPFALLCPRAEDFESHKDRISPNEWGEYVQNAIPLITTLRRVFFEAQDSDLLPVIKGGLVVQLGQEAVRCRRPQPKTMNSGVSPEVARPFLSARLGSAHARILGEGSLGQILPLFGVL